MAGGHDNPAGAPHAHHAGDVPSLLVKQDGTAELDFRTSLFRSTSCWTLTVVVHAGPDNLGNVPTGTATDAYTPNSPAASAKTAATGNAGDRLACGIIHVQR